MKSSDETKSEKQNNPRNVIYKTEGMKYFYFDMSEKNHEIVLPSEQESAWEKLHDIKWDQGRGD